MVAYGSGSETGVDADEENTEAGSDPIAKRRHRLKN
jgi:hypothetical protein